MTDEFTKTNTTIPYIDSLAAAQIAEKPKVNLNVGSTASSSADTLITTLESEFSKADSEYQKVTSKVIVKRYAVKND
jgi:hypothetical protein